MSLARENCADLTNSCNDQYFYADLADQHAGVKSELVEHYGLPDSASHCWQTVYLIKYSGLLY